MSRTRTFARAGALALTAAIAGSVTSGIAAAHVTANIYGEQPTKGGYTAIVMRVPNEDDEKGTIKLSVGIAEEYALGSVRTQPVPGWDAEVTTTTPREPVTNAHGAELDEVVTEITWTAEDGNEIKPDEYQEFTFSTGPLPTDVDQLVLPATQTYEGGKVVAWDEPPAEGKELERPAPVVPLAVEASGHGSGSSDSASATAELTGQRAAETEDVAATSAATDSTARWLGGLGLAFGALGVGFGIGAIARSRQQTTRED
ncbi:YcnI family protein [Haloechinothrix salitolerans]|uniref:YcnI family protein n=1 Tax=Haloechinothrix salitolerans TaxID=926830 RepID=A0ABW2BUU5_9PSEU